MLGLGGSSGPICGVGAWVVFTAYLWDNGPLVREGNRPTHFSRDAGRLSKLVHYSCKILKIDIDFILD